MIKSNFAIFILSHNRIDSIHSLWLLQKSNYKGDWYVVISTDNKQINDYKKRIDADHLLIFNKDDIIFDTMMSTKVKDYRSATYARNFIVQYARSNNISHFIQMDDDIRDVHFKVDINGHIKNVHAHEYLSQIIEYMKEFLDCSPRLSCISLANGNGYFGGVSSIYKIEREVNQFMMFKTSNIVGFRGLQCEDAIISTDDFHNVYLTFRGACVISPKMNGNDGGVEYNPHKTPPTWFWHMVAPSAVKCTGLYNRKRFNANLYVCIIDEKYKKK